MIITLFASRETRVRKLRVILIQMNKTTQLTNNRKLSRFSHMFAEDKSVNKLDLVNITRVSLPLTCLHDLIVVYRVLFK